MLRDSKSNEEGLEKTLRNKEENLRILSDKYLTLQDELEISARNFFTEVENHKQENRRLNEELRRTTQELQSKRLSPHRFT